MARKGKSVYERIDETLANIASTEQTLNELKIQLQSLYEEKEDLEMRQIWSDIKSSGLSFDDVQKLITKQTSKK